MRGCVFFVSLNRRFFSLAALLVAALLARFRFVRRCVDVVALVETRDDSSVDVVARQTRHT